ncbi:MAG TPA: Wzz/FepE/Etk N-terminal domain-containing protein, partial [Gemmatimonadales bacterium]|nr:Wzz/FepE/Etk N-terminal domain-containing protein [Gemmatimonadales bacterium]
MNDSRPSGALAAYGSAPSNGNGRGDAGGAIGAGLSWHDITTAVRRRLWLVLVLPTVLVAGAAVMVWRETPQYRSRAVLRLGDARRSMTSGLELAAEPDRLMDPLLSQIQLLKSRALLGGVVDSLGMRLDLEDSGIPASLIDSVFITADAPVDT